MVSKPADTRIIACDESGAEGENLHAAANKVFVHASVDIDLAEAEAIISGVRTCISSQASELKSVQLLRPQNREALEWFLGESSLVGRGLAYLTEKKYFIVGKIIDLLIEEYTHRHGCDLYAGDRARKMAYLLYNEGERAFGANDWDKLLSAFNAVARSKNRRGLHVSVAEFFELVDRLRLRSRRKSLTTVMDLMWRSREDTSALSHDSIPIPNLDPIFPSLAQTIIHWSGNTTPVTVLHDEQSALREDRVESMRRAFEEPEDSLRPYMPDLMLTALHLVDSKSDARIQVADLLAGAARKISSDELECESDSKLTRLLRPYLHPQSLWGDDPSWRRLMLSELS